MNVKRIALKLGFVSLLAFGANLHAAETSLREILDRVERVLGDGGDARLRRPA